MPPATPTSGENRAPQDLGSQQALPAPTVVGALRGCSQPLRGERSSVTGHGDAVLAANLC